MKKKIIFLVLLVLRCAVVCADDCVSMSCTLTPVALQSVSVSPEARLLSAKDQKVDRYEQLTLNIQPIFAYVTSIEWTVDMNGNPLSKKKVQQQKTDKNGNPVVDGKGNPVYVEVEVDDSITIDQNYSVRIPAKFVCTEQTINKVKDRYPVIITAIVTDILGNEASAEFNLTVYPDQIPLIPIASITVNASDLCYTPGESVNLYDYITVTSSDIKKPATYANNLTFTSQTSNVTVNKNADGTISLSGSGLTPGRVVTVRISDNDLVSNPVHADIQMTVTGGQVTSMSMNRSTATMFVRKHQRTVQLSVQDFLPLCATTDVTWSSADPTIATVDANGLVTAVDTLNTNTVLITATATNGTATATCLVKISRQLPFECAPGKYVEFSSGNLQFIAGQGSHTTIDGQTLDGTWQFAANQYDVVGAGNANVSATYTGPIDLFGWGTSGWDSGKDTYYHPWDTQGKKNQYAVTCVDASFVGAYANYDWGVYNSILESSGTITHAPGSWRTLVRTEWEYIIGVTINDKGQMSTASSARANAAALNTMASVNGIPGLILLPDDWDWDFVSTTIIPASQRWSVAVRDYTTYQFTVAQWQELEKNGATFLPAGGFRLGSGDGKTSVSTTPQEVGVNGYYWSGSDFCENHANVLNFTSTMIGIQENHGDICNRCNGYSIRLVRDIDLEQ